MKLSVIIPAAGASTRFDQGRALAHLVGRPLLLRTVEIFSRRQEVFQIIVAGPPDSMDAFKERFAAGLGFRRGMAGGEDRWETVSNALAAVDETATHVPFTMLLALVSDEVLDRSSAAQRLDAVVPVVSISSTLRDRSFFEDRCRRGW